MYWNRKVGVFEIYLHHPTITLNNSLNVPIPSILKCWGSTHLFNFLTLFYENSSKDSFDAKSSTLGWWHPSPVVYSPPPATVNFAL